MGQAVMSYNRDNGKHCRFILVQIQEETDDKAKKAGFKTIPEIAEERIRRAGRKIVDEIRAKEAPHVNGDATLFDEDSSMFHTRACDLPDVGFRVLRLDTSNMEDVYYTPAELNKESIFSSVENVKADRTGMDLLFQVMPELNIELSAPIEQRTINGHEVLAVKGNHLIATFDRNVDEQTITEIAQLQPTYFAMRNDSAASDNLLDNIEQIFRRYSPDTVRRIL